jgi:hypothetical protein
VTYVILLISLAEVANLKPLAHLFLAASPLPASSRYYIFRIFVIAGRLFRRFLTVLNTIRLKENCFSRAQNDYKLYFNQLRINKIAYGETPHDKDVTVVVRNNDKGYPPQTAF